MNHSSIERPMGQRGSVAQPHRNGRACNCVRRADRAVPGHLVCAGRCNSHNHGPCKQAREPGARTAPMPEVLNFFFTLMCSLMPCLLAPCACVCACSCVRACQCACTWGEGTVCKWRLHACTIAACSALLAAAAAAVLAPSAAAAAAADTHQAIPLAPPLLGQQLEGRALLGHALPAFRAQPGLVPLLLLHASCSPPAPPSSSLLLSCFCGE